MSPIQSRRNPSSDRNSSGRNTCAGDSFLVILKIHGGDINLRHLDGLSGANCKTYPYKILCRDLDANAESQDSRIQVFVLDGLASPKESVVFQEQQCGGQVVDPADLVVFMTAPVDSTRKANYGIDIGVEPQNNVEEIKQDGGFKKVGSAYLYLDSKFATQGVQRMQIMGAHSQAPIGQIQVEYLVVKNPIAYGVKVPRPEWLPPCTKLDAGHRGAGSGCRADLPGDITENTVASFNYAARHGADMCELDVMCTSDGVPVVYHNYVLAANSCVAKQIDQLTLKELRALNDGGIHDKNCKHNLKNSTQVAKQESSRPFPTLEEVLRDVDENCALNIELKWPQMLTNGKSEAIQSREINDFVDRILDCIYQHSHGRAIVLSTLSADIAILLRLKQSRYPVLFLTTGDSQRFTDPATKTVKNAIHFAQAFDMAGINPNAAYLDEYLVKYAKDRGLLVYAWGKIESAQAIKELRSIGTDGVIYDRIDLIKPQD